MIKVTVPGQSFWNQITEEFVYTKTTVLDLEHSLLSVSKWESKWCKPFITKEPKNYDELIDYIRCMTLTKNVDDLVYQCIPDSVIDIVQEYIDSPMTATVIKETKTTGGSDEFITSEIIYYWMIIHNIPFECQKWHLNRLLTLIKVCSIKNQAPKKMSNKEIYSRNAALNAARKKKLHTKG